MKSGAVAAALSFIFPGLGQAYLGLSRAALIFALPVIAVLLVVVLIVVTGGGLVGVGARIFDPGFSFPAALGVVALGLWWIAGIVHAWRNGRSPSSAFIVVPLVLVLVVGVVDVWGATSLYRIGNAGIAISDSTSDPTLDDGPKPTITPAPTPAGQTPDPLATPTPRPPDFVDPSEEPSDEPSPSIEPGPTPGFDITALDAENDGWLNVLLAGVDWWEGRVGARTDTMLVVSVNSESGEVLMFSFPRDLQRFPIYNGGTYSGKLNTFAGVSKLYPDQFPDPGMPSLANQVGFMLGIPIDYYASVNMEGFQEVVRQVGGVTVNNEREIADDHLQFYLSAGEHRLNPADALRYVRSRKGQAGGDFARAHRQQQVLAALKREMLKPENLPRIPDIAEALAEVMNTNYPPNRISELLELAQAVQDEPSQSWVFKDPEWADLMRPAETGLKRPVLVPNLDAIGELSQELFGDASLYSQ
ncbi:MAG TPA: LCP family protein [Candidatus Limnocylindrales bacterium]|nr:LCP family protein [Candidatus Limnocylindrales bacterium]